MSPSHPLHALWINCWRAAWPISRREYEERAWERNRFHFVGYFELGNTSRSGATRLVLVLVLVVVAYNVVFVFRLAASCVTQNTEHWIQRITFAAETNAACSRGSADTHPHTHTHTQTPSTTIPSPLAKQRRKYRALILFWDFRGIKITYLLTYLLAR